MADFIKKLYEELSEIRTYLIKIGPSRRQGNILEKKSKEAGSIVQQYNNYLDNITKIHRSSAEDTLIQEYCERFQALYSEINNLCCNLKMEKFDLKVALNLLPVMTDELLVTKQLIDGIDYYSSVIDKDTHKNLITFVLKSRLSQSAKLKLSTEYESVVKLLSDMKKILLPQKSACSLQKQLLNCRQNDLTVENFGNKLSEMFVDLTISQAENDSSKYNILKSINEKQAIRQFSDGLRNRRIGTIISAQKFETLKDAIQAAVDEDGLSSNSSAEIFAMNKNNMRHHAHNSRQPRYNNNRRGYNRGTYYSGAQQRSYSGPGPSRWSQPRQTAATGFAPQPSPRGRGHNRGKHPRNYNRNYNIRVLSPENVPSELPAEPSTSAQNLESENQFFRD